MTLTDREYKYWITKNCERKNCWIVIAKLGEMLLHVDTKVYGPSGKLEPRDQLHLRHDNLQYVYFAVFDNNKVVTMVQDDKWYYIIENEESIQGEGEEKETKYSSVITYNDNINTLVDSLSGAKKKKLGLKTSDKAKLKESDITALKNVTYIDFIGATQKETKKLWKSYVQKDAKRLDLSGLFLLDPAIITGTYPHTEIIVYQNNKFNTFEWLSCFPKLKILSIWYINTLLDSGIDTIHLSAPELDTIEIHYCPQVTGRVLISLSKMSLLNKIVINNESCEIHTDPYETVIKDAEWKLINNSNVELLLIDSYNLTLDFIYFSLIHFKGLQHYIMNDIIMRKLNDKSVGGHMEQSVVFHSSKDINQGFKRYRDIKVYDLVRSKCGNMFSDSMLKKIEALNPERSDAVMILKSKETDTPEI